MGGIDFNLGSILKPDLLRGPEIPTTGRFPELQVIQLEQMAYTALSSVGGCTCIYGLTTVLCDFLTKINYTL